MFTPQRRAVRAPQGRHVGLAFWEGMLVDSSSVEELGQDRPLVRRLDRDPARRYGPKPHYGDRRGRLGDRTSEPAGEASAAAGWIDAGAARRSGPPTVKVRAGAS